jgi:4-hydroxybenzoate polyprenyltransferase
MVLMPNVLIKFVPKTLVIREEDYWIIAASIVTEVLIMAALYISALAMRIPVILLAGLGLWFTTSKVRQGYGHRNARAHLLFNVTVGGLLFLCLYLLTN